MRMELKDLPLEGIELHSNGSFSAMALCDYKTGMETFTFIEDARYLHFISDNPDITCVMCTNALIEMIPASITGMCVSDTPKTDFFMLHNRLCNVDEYKRDSFKTKIGENCTISPMAHIDSENVIIGNNVRIEEFVSIKARSQIGDNVTLRSGSVIGCDGYEFKPRFDDMFYVEHAGGVIIGNYVDIYSNTCICKALFPWDDTIIGEYTKIDNLVHIAHACKIGKRNFIVASVVVCGAAETSDDVYIGPNATIAKIHMSENSKASLGSVVTKNVAANMTVSGNFAIEHSRMINHIKKISRG